MVIRDAMVGAAAGVVATGPMTLIMLAIRRELPWYERHALPPRHIIENATRHLGIRHRLSDSERLALAVVAHCGYGGGAGAVYGPVSQLVPVPAVASGIGYGLLVWAGSYLGLLPAFKLYPSPTSGAKGRTVMMVIAHIVWGATLGLGVAAGQRFLNAETSSALKSMRPSTPTHQWRRRRYSLGRV